MEIFFVSSTSFLIFFSVEVSGGSVGIDRHTKSATIGAVAGFDPDRLGRVALLCLEESSRLREEGVDDLARLILRDGLAPHLKHLIGGLVVVVFHSSENDRKTAAHKIFFDYFFRQFPCQVIFFVRLA